MKYSYVTPEHGSISSIKSYQSFLFINCYLLRSLDELVCKQPDAVHRQTLRLQGLGVLQKLKVVSYTGVTVYEEALQFLLPPNVIRMPLAIQHPFISTMSHESNQDSARCPAKGCRQHYVFLHASAAGLSLGNATRSITPRLLFPGHMTAC